MAMVTLADITTLDFLEERINAFTVDPENAEIFRIPMDTIERVYTGVRYASLQVFKGGKWMRINLGIKNTIAFAPVRTNSEIMNARISFDAPQADATNEITRIACAYKALAQIATVLLAAGTAKGVEPEIYKRPIVTRALVEVDAKKKPLAIQCLHLNVKFGQIAGIVKPTSKTDIRLYASGILVNEMTFSAFNGYLPSGSLVRVVVNFSGIVFSKNIANLRPEVIMINRLKLGDGACGVAISEMDALAAMDAAECDGAGVSSAAPSAAPSPAPQAPVPTPIKPKAKRAVPAVDPNEVETPYDEMPIVVPTRKGKGKKPSEDHA